MSSIRSKKMTRREALSTVGKIATSVVITGVVAGVGGYYVGKTTGAAAPTAANRLSVMTSIPEATAAEILSHAEKDLGIKIDLWRGSEGKGIAKVRAEAAAGKITEDAIFLYDYETFLIWKDEGYLIPYVPPGAKDLIVPPIPGGYGTPVIFSPLAFIVNTDVLSKEGLEPPKSWKDLTDPKWKGKIIAPDPLTSGTAFSIMETLIQLFGEDGYFDFWKKVHPNVHHYEESGITITTLVAKGEFPIGITYDYTMYDVKLKGYPIDIIYPSEGVGYKTECVGILRDIPAERLELAKEFINWATSPKGMKWYAEVGHLYPTIPKGVTLPDYMTPWDKLPLVHYDRAYFAENRDRLVKKWAEIFKG
ncbi:extracellular solute-binding protein [Candidatus Bathyarchaeota archaeon]|nr:extracellular solute-binding protein [Candidatus Bathyarchaeota archaeon]